MPNIPNALKHLFPLASPLRDYRIQDNSDGNGPYIAAWLLPDPHPTLPQLAAASDAYDAALALALADAAALRSSVRTLAASSVGVAFGSLNPPEVRALLAVLLHKAGALDRDGVIRPLAAWDE